MAASNITEGSEESCQFCQDIGKYRTVDYMCADCAAPMCSQCTREHESSSAFRDHLIHLYAPILLQENMCKTHRQRTTGYWCKLCMVAVCSSCIMQQHKDHEIRKIKQHVQDLIAPLKPVSENVLKTLEWHSDKEEALADQLPNLDTSFSEIEDQIQRQSRACIKMVKEQTGDLLGKLKEYQRRQKVNIQHNLDNERNNMKMIEQWRDRLKTTLALQPSSETFLEIKRLVEEGENLNNNVCNSSETVMPVFIPEDCDVKLGQLVDKENDTTTSQALSSSVGQGNTIDGGVVKEVTPTINGATPGLGAAEQSNTTEAEAVAEVTPTVKDTLLWEISGCNAVNDLVFVTPNILCIIQINSITTYRIAKHDTLPEMNLQFLHERDLDRHTLWHAAAARDCPILYVTCFKCNTIHAYNIDTRRLENRRWRQQMFYNPSAVAVTNNGNILVLDSGDGFIYIMSPEGAEIKTIGMFDKGNSSQKRMYNMACDDYDNVAISISYMRRVFVNNTSTLDNRETYTVAGHNELHEPQGLCIDDRRHVIVADKGNNNLTEFDLKGRFVRHPLSGLLNATNGPWYVDFTTVNDIRLLAVAYFTNRVEIAIFRV